MNKDRMLELSDTKFQLEYFDQNKKWWTKNVRANGDVVICENSGCTWTFKNSRLLRDFEGTKYCPPCYVNKVLELLQSDEVSSTKLEYHLKTIRVLNRQIVPITLS